MLASTARLVTHARDHGFAVPAVNVFDDVSLRAVVAAAVDRSAPLIVQISVKTVKSVGLGLVTALFENAVKDVTVPVALHLDHCPDRAVLDAVIAAKWSSVLFDASDRDLATAEAETTEVVAAAHAAGVDVESEIENIIGVEDGVGSDVALHSYSAQELAEVAERTGVDLLAPQLGTSHGAYRSRPQLLPERVREIARYCSLPVVLHGGTGLAEADFRSFIDAGVGKVNVSTAVKEAYLKAAADHLDAARAADKWDPPKLFDAVGRAVTAEIGTYFEMFGADGKAAAAQEALR